MGLLYAPFNTNEDNQLKHAAKIKAFRRGLYANTTEMFGGLIRKGGDESNTTTTTMNKLNQTDKVKFKNHMEKIDTKIRENITNSLNKVMTETMTEVMSKNENILKVVAQGTNVFKLNNAFIKAKEDINLNFNQENDVDVKAEQDAEISIINEITSSVSKSASTSITDKLKDGERLGEALAGTINNAVDAVAGVANNGIDTLGETVQTAVTEAAGVLNTGIAAAAGVGTSLVQGLTGSGTTTNTNTNTNSDITTTSEKETDLSSIQRTTDEHRNTINLEEIMENVMKTNITNETFNECDANAIAQNTSVIDNVTFESTGGKVNLNLKQSNKVKVAIKCITRTEIVNKISQEILNNLETAVAALDLDEGTLEAAGAAVAGAVTAAGDAVGGVIEETGDASAKVIKTTGDAISQNTMGIVLIAVIAVVVIIVMNPGEKKGSK